VSCSLEHNLEIAMLHSPDDDGVRFASRIRVYMRVYRRRRNGRNCVKKSAVIDIANQAVGLFS
jgi:hypothetical protein